FTRKDRACLDLKCDLSALPLCFLHEISRAIDLCDQIADYLSALFSFILCKISRDRFAVVIASFDHRDQPLLITGYSDFRIYSDGDHTAFRLLLNLER